MRLLEQDASLGQVLLYRAGMQLLLVLLMRSVQASALARYRYAHLVFAAVSGYAIFGERVAATTVIGAVLIVGSSLGLWWFKRVRTTGTGP